MLINKKATLHQAIQDILVEVLKEFEIEAKKEFLNIDTIAKDKSNNIITIEIETSGNNQNNNMEKCLFLNPKKHIHIFIDKEPSEDILKYSNQENVKILIYKTSKGINKPKQEEAFKIFKEIVSKKIPLKEQILEFRKRTGMTERTFFRYKKMLETLSKVEGGKA